MMYPQLLVLHLAVSLVLTLTHARADFHRLEEETRYLTDEHYRTTHHV